VHPLHPFLGFKKWTWGPPPKVAQDYYTILHHPSTSCKVWRLFAGGCTGCAILPGPFPGSNFGFEGGAQGCTGVHRGCTGVHRAFPRLDIGFERGAQGCTVDFYGRQKFVGLSIQRRQMSAKNIINQNLGTSSSSSSTSTSTSNVWYAPTNGSRSIQLRPLNTTGYPITQANYWGVYFDELNGQSINTSTSQVLTISDPDNGLVPLTVHRHRFPNNPDPDYLDIYSDTEYEGGATMILCLKACTLLITGCICIDKISGVNTQSIGVGVIFKYSDSTGFVNVPYSYGQYTIEPAAGGSAFPLTVIQNFVAGAILKIYIGATCGTSVLRLHSGTDSAGGLCGQQTMVTVTRISNS
jgi:hypothetical protein